MARIVIAGAGAIGANIAYQLALRGADDVVLADRERVASGATGKAMGGVRQQFSTAAEVRLARESIGFFRELGPSFFQPVGYLFLATTEDGLATLEERAELQRGLGVPVERVDASRVEGLRVDDVVGAVCCWEDGVADPPAVTRELVRRAGVELREGVDARELDRDVLVIAAGADFRGALAGASRAAALPSAGRGRPGRRPAGRPADGARGGDRASTSVARATRFGSRWPSRPRAGRTARRWTRRSSRTGARAWLTDIPPAAAAPVARAWAGLYDMTPDAHPIIGWVGEGVYAACGFSGHGFMQSPAVGKAVAEELLGRESSFDLSPYRLERFDDDAVFPEELVL